MATAALQQPRRSIFARPTATTGWYSWVTTVDHKKIGIMYGVTAFIFFLLGGLEALAIRAQLAVPNGEVLTAEVYNQFFTMHGVTMIFLVVMPMGVAFFNYFAPLMIGARDVAFPRLNALSYWIFLFGGIFIYSSFFLGGAPDGGWFGYAPLSTQAGQDAASGLADRGMDFYAVGLQFLGIASLAGAVNFIVTILNMRAPGMTLMRMPVFIWMTLVVSFLLLFAMPIIAVALFELMFDRLFGTRFFAASAGGDPILWQHLFWLFGHPEVYILILPAMGIVSEVLPTFSRKPIFGYAAVVFAGAAIGFMGWGVWAHHMFAAGLGPVANSAFALSTMFIAVPTGVKIFNWIGTMWGGSLRFTTSMMFSIGFIAMFIIGGLSGVTHAIVPHDAQQTDTYYVVAHFHYVLFGGALFGIMSGFYYWWPKIFGHRLSEKIGKWNFWLWFIGFNLTFGPMHIVGLQGMPRRIYTYPDGMGWNVWNMMETVGSFMIAVATLIFLFNVAVSRRKGREEAGADPWDARTLEWSIPSPPPEYNFAEVPVVTHRDEFWHRKYFVGPGKTVEPVFSGGAVDHSEHAEHDGGHHIHLPSPSYFPVVAAFGMLVSAYAVIFALPAVAIGILIMTLGFFGWVFEPGTAE